MARPRSNFICSVDGCDNPAHAKGWCRQHWTRMHLYGRLELIKGIVKGTCQAEGCNNPIKGKGFCNNHYQMNRRYGRTTKEKKPSKTLHPFYTMWFERKQTKNLCERWLDFWNFVSDIGSRPADNFVLVKINSNEIYGPDNFKWQENLIKTPEETEQEWFARKWESRRNRNPDEEYERNLQRSFGISLEDYNRKLWLQNNVCAICNQKETIVYKSGRIKRLAVDHCHNSNKIRDLLCSRCNTTIGSVEDNIELLHKMIAYLTKHKDL